MPCSPTATTPTPSQTHPPLPTAITTTTTTIILLLLQLLVLLLLLPLLLLTEYAQNQMFKALIERLLKMFFLSFKLLILILDFL